MILSLHCFFSEITVPLCTVGSGGVLWNESGRRSSQLPLRALRHLEHFLPKICARLSAALIIVPPDIVVLDPRRLTLLDVEHL